MTEDLVMDIAQNSLMVTIYASLPMLGISMAVGLIISIIQTTTSIQEQTLTFVPKLIAIFLAVLVFGVWILHLLMDFTYKLWELIPIMAT
ncbi:MAG TPA: flagellar biosynthesis protein FliQ [bacterium]|nr:flagellar biosynthesis protein FliQ [bacterium]HPN31142.1 flagellar biosynthesis protein FliQ [bacterium]